MIFVYSTFMLLISLTFYGSSSLPRIKKYYLFNIYFSFFLILFPIFLNLNIIIFPNLENKILNTLTYIPRDESRRLIIIISMIYLIMPIIIVGNNYKIKSFQRNTLFFMFILYTKFFTFFFALNFIGILSVTHLNEMDFLIYHAYVEYVYLYGFLFVINYLQQVEKYFTADVKNYFFIFKFCVNSDILLYK